MLQDLKLLNRFVGKVLQQAADDVVLVVAAVDVDVELPAVAAVHGEVADARLGRVEVAGWPRFRHHDREIGERPVEQRQIGDVFRRHDAAEIGAGRVDQRRTDVDGDGFGDGADRQLEREGRPRPDEDVDVLADDLLETLPLGGDAVPPGRQERDDEIAGVVGGGRTLKSGSGIARDDGRAGHDLSGLIGDASGQFAGRRLRGGIAWHRQRDRAREDQYGSQSASRHVCGPPSPRVNDQRSSASGHRSGRV